jgi:hypothetical protein
MEFAGHRQRFAVHPSDGDGSYLALDKNETALVGVDEDDALTITIEPAPAKKGEAPADRGRGSAGIHGEPDGDHAAAADDYHGIEKTGLMTGDHSVMRPRAVPPTRRDSISILERMPRLLHSANHWHQTGWTPA